MVRKGYTPEQIVNKLREGEALLTSSSRGHPACAFLRTVTIFLIVTPVANESQTMTCLK